jgi:hypothetical protein
VETALAAVRLLLDRAKAGGVLSELLPEALCVWVGDDASRRSRSVGSSALSQALAGPPADTAPVALRAAAALLGQRRAANATALPEHLAHWHRCGRLLPDWPLDVVMRTCEAAGGPAVLADEVRRASGLADASVAAAMRELLLTAAPAEEFLRALRGQSELSEATVRLLAEPVRRVGLVADAQRSAIEFARARTGVVGAFFARDAASPEAKARQTFRAIYLGRVEQLRAARTKPPRDGRELHTLLYAEALCEAHLGDPGFVRDALRRGLGRGDGGRWDDVHVSFEELADRAVGLIWAAAGSRNTGVLGAWPATASLLAARCGLPLDDPGAAEGVRQWVSACCETATPGPSGDRQVRLAMFGLLTAWAAAHGKRQAQTAILAALGRHARGVLAAAEQGFTCTRPKGKPGPCAWEGHTVREQLSAIVRFIGLATVAGVPDELVAKALAGKWGRLLHPALSETPDRAVKVLRWLDRLSRAHDDDGPPIRLPWPEHYDAFCGNGLAYSDERLLDRLVQAAPAAAGVAARGMEAVFRFIDADQLAPRRGVTGAQRRAARRRERFLVEHPEIVDAVVRPPAESEAVTPNNSRLWLWAACAAVAQAWNDLAWPDTGGLFAAFFQECLRRHAGWGGRWISLFADAEGDALRALLGLSTGQPERAIHIGFSSIELTCRDGEALAAAWKWLRPAPRVREALAACAARADLLPRVQRWLVRAGVCARLPDAPRLRDELAALVTADGPEAPALLERLRREFPPLAGLPEELTGRLVRLIGQNAGRVPQRLSDVLVRPSRLESQRQTLEGSADLANARVAARLRNLRSYLDDAGRLQAWVEKDLRKILDASADDVTLSAMERLTQQVMQRHVRRLAGGPPPPGHDPADWDNAVRLYFSIDRNRGILRRLLRQEAGGKDARVFDHPANRRFLDAMRQRGIDVEVWAGRFAETAETPRGSLTVSLETDPLKVLQMGNYFRTCLSEGGVNAFATVANACEANKRVAYVRNARGAVVGRKLLAMTAGGRILGFRSYGAGDFQSWAAEEGPRSSPWVKVVLDVFCRRLADACRTTLHPVPREPEGDAAPEFDTELKLFAQWYNDGAEAYDRWWLDHSPGDLRAGVVEGGAVFERLLAELGGMGAGEERTDPAVAGPALRAALWLGEDAAELVRSLVRRHRTAGTPAAEQSLRGLSRHALSAQVRETAAAGLSPE